MAPSSESHLELFEARLAEFRQAGIEIYPSDLEDQLREPEIRQRIHEIEEETHDLAQSSEGRPGEDFIPPQLPPDLFDFRVDGLRSFFYYRRGELNYDVKATPTLREHLGDVIPDLPPDPGGFRNVRIPEGRFANFQTDPEADLRALKELRDHLRHDVFPDDKYDHVGPNHVFTGGPIDCGGPGSEPEPSPLSSIPETAGNAGHGVRVAVLDSGILPRRLLPDFLNRELIVGPEDVEEDFFDLVEGGQKIIRFPRIHGTFVAGIIRRAAPGATLLIKRVLDRIGVVHEDVLARKLEEVLGAHPHIINLSLGCKSYTGDMPASLHHAFERLRSIRPEIVVVAAGGNEGRAINFWPAVEKDVLGVGSVDASGRWAHSNFGPPVDIWARGKDVDGVYAAGTYQREATKNEGVVFPNPVARWTGTSFAAPLVTGMIAAAMTENGTRSAVEAKNVVVRSGRSTIDLPIPIGSDDEHVPLVLKEVTLP